MTALATPFGIKPLYHDRGGIQRAKQRTIASGYNTAIPQYAPVKIAASGGTIQLAAAGERNVGIFMGCEYTESGGQRRVNNIWPANTVATDIIAWILEDPGIDYIIQANATLTIDSIGSQYDWANPGVFNAFLNFSQAVLNVASVATNAGLQVMDLLGTPDNAWGDAFPIVIVRFSEHQFVADVAQF